MAESHVRIDEGIKRGPKNQRRSVPRRRDQETGRVVAIPANLDPKLVLERYLTEQTTSQIAQEFGVTRKSLVAWLRDTVPLDWKRVQVLRALCRKEDADEDIEVATDALSLARAREMLRSGQWDLERLDASNFGQQIAVKSQVVIADDDAGLLTSARELLLLFKSRQEKVINAVEIAAPATIEEKPL